MRFPEVDAAALGEHRDAVTAAASAVEEAERALAAANRVLTEKRQALAALGKRALSYVRVYAEERPELRERLESMQSARLKAPEPKRRGRPKKSEPEQPTLPTA